MKIFCIGKNYAAHAHEMKSEIPKEPVVFMKPETALRPFSFPKFSGNIHYECELVIKISKNGKNISVANAHEYWDEITLGIDFTARDLQDDLKKKGLPWEKCKSFDGSAFVGKWLHKKEIKNIVDIEFSFFKNDNRVQHGFSADMIFNFDEIIADISTYFSLSAGDFIFTGTPQGIGAIAHGDKLSGILEGKEMFTVSV